MHPADSKPEFTDNRSALVTSLQGQATDEDFRNWFFWTKMGYPEQPTDQAITLISYLYAIKDGCTHQPLFADSEETLETLKREMLKTKPGTETTVIFDKINKERTHQEDRVDHRLAIKYIRTEEGLISIALNTLTEKNPAITIQHFDHALAEIDTLHTELDDEIWDRQKDGFSCGIYAIKDARELNRSTGLDSAEALESHKAQFQKSNQHVDVLEESEFAWLANHKSKHFGRKINRKGVEVDANFYVENFARKYCEMIRQFLDMHTVEDPTTHTKMIQRDILLSIIEKYDASLITASELENRYNDRIKNENVIFQRKVERVLSRGKSPDSTDANGETLLSRAIHLYALSSDPALITVIETLLKAGATPKIPGAEKALPEGIKNLLDAHATPDANMALPTTNNHASAAARPDTHFGFFRKGPENKNETDSKQLPAGPSNITLPKT